MYFVTPVAVLLATVYLRTRPLPSYLSQSLNESTWIFDDFRKKQTYSIAVTSFLSLKDKI